VVKDIILPWLSGWLHGTANDEGGNDRLLRRPVDPDGDTERLQHIWKTMLFDGRRWNMLVSHFGPRMLALIPASLLPSHFL